MKINTFLGELTDISAKNCSHSVRMAWILYDKDIFKRKRASALIQKWMQNTIVNRRDAPCARARCLTHNLCMRCRTSFGKATFLSSL